jgi:chemotaxis protein methyltransferase CheR
MNQLNEANQQNWYGNTDELTDKQFQRLAAFIHDYSGIKMPPSKRSMLEGRLRRRVRVLGLANLSEYYDYLFDRGGLAAEEVDLIDAITTNKTEFFREPEHFKILAEKLLPHIVRDRQVSSRNPIKIWSAAASTGVEAYTIAIVLAEFERTQPAASGIVFGTDISSEVLQVAHAGIYPDDVLAPIRADLRARYLMRAKDRTSINSRIVPELRARVSFSRLNLMDSVYSLDRDMDVIFCRNILIYFERQTQCDVLAKLCAHLRPGGYLILGHSESLNGFDLPVRPVGTTVFCRK